MKNYIISEEELMKFNAFYDVKNYLKSLQPVELLDEGLLKIGSKMEAWLIVEKGWFKGNKHWINNLLLKFDNQNIKIYIQKEINK